MGNLITLADVKAELPIRSGNTDFDARINEVIATAESQIETFCRRTFSTQSYSEIFHVQQGATTSLDLLNGANSTGTYTTASSQPFYLKNGPLDEDSDVRVFYDLTHRFGEDTELLADDFTVLLEKACVYVYKPLLKSRDSVKITYTGGYTSVPSELKFAAVMQAVHLYKRSLAENVSTASDKDEKSKEPYTVVSGLLPEVSSILVPYRKLLRGRE